MTDRSHDEHRVTGILLHEPTFPNLPADSRHSEGAESRLSQDMAPSDTVQEGVSQAQPVLATKHIETVQDNAAPSRPTQPRSATERPKPSVRHSLLGRKHPGTRGEQSTQLDNSANLTFDPYSSASESSSDPESDSSDDDERFPKQSLGHDNDLVKQETRRSRRGDSGPFSRLKIKNEHFNTRGKVSKADGRLKLNILEKDLDNGYIAKALGAVLKKHTKDAGEAVESYDAYGIGSTKIAPEDDEMEHNLSRRIQLNIVIIIIGSRGDIQPFIRIAKILKEDYGHRVRLATHPAFKDFVEKDSGLEFFSIGGNPAELMAFMVKNPGLIPNISTIKDGEIGRRRAQMYEMFQGMWRACINATDDETDKTNAKMMGAKAPFVADAVISNPPSIAPFSICEKLGIPLHMMFTFPYTPTVDFPHPLANIKTTNVEATYGNFLSYPLVELMVWQGLGDLINRFRTQILHLEEVSTLWAPGQLFRLKVPYTYCWSPGLIPKPQDWGNEIDIAGFVFLDLASSFTPPDDLKKFLDGGDPPVYIGFGSIVVDNPDEFTKLIFEAVKIAGCRALISKGWGGFGSNANCPDNVFMIDNTPHDWLFPRCSAVVHHGGAGTTAIGLKLAKPTCIVPFFGDQPFWGAAVSKAKAGAHECIPYKKLTAEILAESIKQCLTEEAKANVQKIAECIAKDGDGALNAVRSFHRSLPLRGQGSMRCDFLDNRAAAWKIKNTNVKLSALAAEILVEKKKLKWSELRLIRHYEWNDFGGPGEPITGAWGSLMSSVTDAATGVGGVPVEMGKSIRKREKLREKKRRIQKRDEHKRATLAKANTELSQTKLSSLPATDGSAPNEGPQKSNRPEAKREESTLSKISEPDEELAEELGREAASGFRKTGSAIARFPMKFALAVTQGFHNAPRLYGDETVRRPPRVTGLHSGLRAGRDELIYGVKDGVTGVVTQPYRGAKNKGVMGAVKGVGFGVGGFVLKDIAALIGPVAYSLKGLDAEYMKRYQPTNYLRRARIAQGQLELQDLESNTRASHVNELQEGKDKTPEKRSLVEHNVGVRWQSLQQTIAEEKKHHKSGLVATLTGHGDQKEGQRVGRKSTEAAKKEERRSQSKVRTTPVVQSEMPMTKDGKKSMDRNHGRTSIDERGTGGALHRSSTAPITTVELEGHGDRQALDRPPIPSKRQLADQESSKTDPRDLGNAHLIDPVKNKSDPELVEAADVHVSTDYASPDSKELGDLHGRPTPDSGSERTRVESSTTDWAAVRQKAEGLEDRSQPLQLDV